MLCAEDTTHSASATMAVLIIAFLQLSQKGSELPFSPFVDL